MDSNLPVVVYDVETLRGPDETKGGWGNPHSFGFGTAVVYFENTDYYGFYGPEHLEKLQADLEGKYVVGFNSIGFDNKVIFGNNYRGAHPREDKSKDCDLLLRVICSKFQVQSLRRALKKHGPRKVFDGSCKLDAIARATLGIHKSGDGAMAPLMIRQKQWARVFAYNLHDVRITYKLFCFARDKGFLIDGKGNSVRVII